MKKKLTAVLAAALALSMLGGCTAAHPLPDGFDQDVVADAAQAVLADVIEGDYQAVLDAFRDDMVETYSVTTEMIQTIAEDAQKDAGKYVSTEETLVLGGESKEFKEPFAAVAIYCEYEDEDIIYEMSLDANLELIGFSAKQK